MKQVSKLVIAGVLACGLSGFASAQAPNGVNGGNVHFASCKGSAGAIQYADTGAGQWAALFKNTAHGTYTERKRDQWSVYLEGGPGDYVQLDMFKMSCSWTKEGTTRLYTVIDAQTLQ